MQTVSYLHQPNIDPVLIRLWGPFQVRWYSLLYVGAFVLARYIMAKLSKEERYKFSAEEIEQFIVWGLVGAVVGSRIIYCLVYDFESLAQNPFTLFQVYRGGLSFHGGLLGTIVAAFLFARKNEIPFWNLTDAMALATPSGLAMGRLGNFINGELYGRVSTVPWAIIYRDGGPLPRHPSQIYELFLEGIVLFIVLWSFRRKLTRNGQISLLFLIGYSVARFLGEFFREPDQQIGYLSLGMTMGQILSLVTIAAAITTWKIVFKKESGG